nr:MAG TPA: hypothetical protein [Caudoviricetes sp.]
MNRDVSVNPKSFRYGNTESIYNLKTINVCNA